MDAMKVFTEGLLKKEPPVFNIGDTVRVSVRIKEGERERNQAFEGTVIAKKHGGISETFTVRRTSYGVGVERVFPMHSPFVEKVEVVRKVSSPRQAVLSARAHRQGRQGQGRASINFEKGECKFSLFCISGGKNRPPGMRAAYEKRKKSARASGLSGTTRL